MRWMVCVLAAMGSVGAAAQWEMQESHTTASLRGIHSLGKGVAWASGSGGTVLRTVDGGKNWQVCAVPDGDRDGAKLDFRGVQGFDASTAIVMASGKGELSRLYKTVDGCGTWKLVAKNPDKEGFWDTVVSYSDINRISSDDPERALILGDSVAGEPKIWEWKEGWEERELEPFYYVHGKVSQGEGSFAASNSALEVAVTPQMDKVWKWSLRWASQTADHVFMSYVREETGACEPCRVEATRVEVPMAGETAGAGIFSFHFRTEFQGVAVGGDYQKADIVERTAAYSSDGGLNWHLARTAPHGYRSAVAYDAKAKTWITVGPNGTDVSFDDGRNWRALRTGLNEPADADKNWNALSLPFVVGPKGRIGVLRDGALKRP